mgnify:FL=1|nr:DUF6329 domain-containing protein [uncultured Oscillibacter sp.]
MKFKANFVEKPGNFQMDDCQIEKVVELSHEDFCRLKIAPLENQPFLAENKDCMFSRDGVIHCLLALDQDGNDGILVDAEGYDYARLAAYVPGMRDIMNAEMGYRLERHQPEIRVRDVLPLLKEELACLCHEEAEQYAPVEDLRRLSDAGRVDFAALLDAGVSEIRASPEGTEVVLTGVDPEELARFSEAHDAFMEAERAMGPVMG